MATAAGVGRDCRRTEPDNHRDPEGGALTDRAIYFRNDLAFAANPAIGKNPHAFLFNFIESYFAAHRVDETGVFTTGSLGYYYDEVVKVDGWWLFARRHFRPWPPAEGTSPIAPGVAPTTAVDPKAGRHIALTFRSDFT